MSEGGSLPTNWKSKKKKKKGARLLAEGALLVTEAALLLNMSTSVKNHPRLRVAEGTS